MSIRFVLPCIFLLTISAKAQDVDSLLNRLQGVKPRQNDFNLRGFDVAFNADGINITCQSKDVSFTRSAIRKAFRKLHVKEKDLKKSDSLLHRNNYYVPGQYWRMYDVYGFLDYHFVEDGDRVVAFSFKSTYKVDLAYKRAFIQLFLDGRIPDEIYQPSTTLKVDFAGRELNLWGGCDWLEPNSLQCTNNGGMNWSSFKSKELAQSNIDDQLKFIKDGGFGEVVSEHQVTVVFEGQEVEGTKIVVRRQIHQAHSTVSVLETRYLVVARIRGRFVTCLIYHGQYEQLNENGVPILPAQVMELKRK